METRLEGEKPQIEGVIPTPVEGEKPTQQGDTKPTVRMYTEEEHKQALDKGIGKGLSTLNQQLSAANKEKQQALKLANQAEEQARRARKDADELASSLKENDPDLHRSYTDRQRIEREFDEARKIRQEADQKIEEAGALAQAAILGKKAIELNKEYGIDFSELETCQTSEEMEIKALKFKLQATKPQEQEVEQKFDSASSSGGGGTSFTREQIANMTQGEFEANQSAINKARREGKIK